jgi:CRISPR-associated protein Cmr3
MTWTLIFHPLDSVLFKDGRPFNQDDAGRASASSLFPPTAETMMGAVRAALAAGKGWSGGNWADGTARFDGAGTDKDRSHELTRVLGNRGDPGSLRLSGPFVVAKRGNRWIPFYPMPQFLLTPLDLDEKIARAATNPAENAGLQPLRPSSAGLSGDLGEDVKLPDFLGNPEAVKKLAERKWDDAGGWWLDHDGMCAALQRRNVPATSVRATNGKNDQALTMAERRIGLARVADSRMALPGMLYAAARLRLHDDIAIAVEVSGVDQDWPLPACVAFGGEGRFAALERLPGGLNIGSVEELNVEGTVYAAILVTPACLDDTPPPGRQVTGLDGTLEALGSVRGGAVGGWNADTRRPEPMKSVMPAGAAFFMRRARAGPLPAARAMGSRTEWGYGRWVAAKWPG